MKKTLLYIKIFIAFILIYLLQSNFFTWFNIMGIQPNLFIILILFCGLFIGKISGMVCGVIAGILIDLFIQTDVIIEPIMLGILGYISGIVTKNFSKENRMNIMLMVIVATFAYEIGVYILRIFVNKVQFEILPLIKILLIEMLYNAMITIIIYPIINHFGQKIEESLFGDRITKYF